MSTDPEELRQFNELLLQSAPEGYNPFYFPLEQNGKEPRNGISWKNNRKTLKEAMALMKRGYNIGIAATEKDALVIVDIDDKSQVPSIKPTLQVISRKRIGTHNYFFCPDGSAKKNIPTHDAGEVRAVWQYVVAPGSFVPCSEEEISQMPESETDFGGCYSLGNKISPDTITFDELPEVYRCRYQQMNNDAIQSMLRKHEKKPRKNRVMGDFRSALWDLTINDVTGCRDTGNMKIPMPRDNHNSETGHNCSINNGLLHCWRHYVAHNAFSYLCVLAGVTTCERAGFPHGGHSFGVDSGDGQTVFEVWKYAKQRGLIPENDPIPLTALVYFAVNRRLCKKEELLGKSRVPQSAIMVGRYAAKQEGFNLGR